MNECFPSRRLLGAESAKKKSLNLDFLDVPRNFLHVIINIIQEVNLSWGGQGSPMLEFRLKIDDLEAPECLTYTLSATLSVGTEAEASGTVKTRCGESLLMYMIFPLETIDCDPSTFGVQLEVNIIGFGKKSYDLTFQGGGGCFG